MTNSLLFEFTVDKLSNMVFVTREFEADQQSVWDAFTKQEILDQWWAPRPWASKTKYMNFEVGGRRFYALRSPEGQEHWSIEAYTAIEPIINFKYTCAFTDKDENINNGISPSEWNLDFSEASDITTVSISLKHKTLASLEQLIKMGFKEGFTSTLNDLSQLLITLKK
jgi:uncharacterized protein YndB with AHSA1/START domain